jgi:hypothetical protein
MSRSRLFDSEFSLERLEMKLSPTSFSFVEAPVLPVVTSLDDPLPNPEPPPPPTDPPIPDPPLPPSGPIGPG